ncbi:hypothetical protein Pmar_PMAR025858 [Perkinsus marinus ATCC 50983]|uniref:Uncharacterized protein n=1 Tax=Perkinsus marinus (strain ATCC 50983 / TXsc) TaxID=423536 RepID=C5LUX0_PERM5|nr:hypothetical protein Pmar_PMAR025858 [Perkinsus marinus ATCC 50983]EEQ99470.1 hypothetical protein Pmar_PMAR025858 [Perkinsus marinus ATCC 50983]|eukprot:XP_002766753.1 hypothetical protein Pmar_PMAR025858 [Perkinsus marinus ATCC 50983]
MDTCPENSVKQARHRQMTCGWDSDVDPSVEDVESVASGPDLHTAIVGLPPGAEIVDEESKLTEKVPELLETMNSSAERLNTLERELGAVEKRRHHLATEWRKRKQQLLPLIGRSVLERTKAYYEACALLGDSQQAVHTATGQFKKAVEEVDRIKLLMAGAEDEFSAIEEEDNADVHASGTARESVSTGSTVGDDKDSDPVEAAPSSKPGRHRTSSIVLKTADEQIRLAELSAKLLAAQSARDAAERACVMRTSEYRSLQMLIARLKKDATERAIKKAEPWYNNFATFSEMSNRELAKAGKLKASIRATKKEYQEAMQSLEQISNKVHESRRGNDEGI